MTTESSELPFGMDAVKAAFKNFKHIDLPPKKVDTKFMIPKLAFRTLQATCILEQSDASGGYTVSWA